MRLMSSEWAPSMICTAVLLPLRPPQLLRRVIDLQKQFKGNSELRMKI
jgi:hypothetical protein